MNTINTELLKSKKFRAACLAALSSVLTFCVTKFGLNWDVGEIMALVGTISAPFLIYIGAEGYSEAEMKRAQVEAMARKDVAEQILSRAEQSTNNPSPPLT